MVLAGSCATTKQVQHLGAETGLRLGSEKVQNKNFMATKSGPGRIKIFADSSLLDARIKEFLFLENGHMTLSGQLE